MDAIQISNVTKRYRDTLALEGISFRFEAGRIYGLLGRNGAGKSTLINIIANRIFATDGCVTIDGEPVCENDRVQEKLYCMSEADLYPAGMRVKDIFKWTGSFYGCFDLEKAHKLAEAYELNVNKKVRALSTGYKSMFKLITALCLDVPYVIFDEPVLGLDANHRELFYRLLLESYQEKPRTIIIATHLIEEVANLIEEVVIIDRGRILLQDSVERLMATGYSIAGSQADVDTYCAGEQVFGCDLLGGMKIAYLMGGVREEKLHAGLHVSAMNLQKLFVKLTEKEVSSHEA